MSVRLDIKKDPKQPLEEPSLAPLKMPVVKRNVSYANTCAVILIPSRKEYIDAGIDLWYNKKDQTSAQSQVANELKQLITYNPALTVETAMKFLYQPYVHLDCAMFDVQSPNTGDPLHMMIIDKSEGTAKDTSQTVTQIIQNYKTWDITFNHSSSAEAAMRHFSHPSGHSTKVDVLLVDESVFESCCNMHSSLAGLINTFRSAYGATVLIGVCLSNTNDSQDVRECAVRVGVDFIWSKPVSLYVDMLPLMLVSRTKEKRPATPSCRERAIRGTSALLNAASLPPKVSLGQDCSLGSHSLSPTTVFNLKSPCPGQTRKHIVETHSPPAVTACSV
jgi:hypothetical protein